MNLTPKYYVTLNPSRRKNLRVIELITTLVPEDRKKLSQLDVGICCEVPSGILRRAKRVEADAVDAIFRHLMLSVTGHLALHPDEFMVHYETLGYGILHDLAGLDPSDRKTGFDKFHKTGKIDPRCVGWVLPSCFVRD